MNVQRYTRVVSAGEDIILGPTTGDETILGSNGTFAHIDQDFVRWKLNDPSSPTARTPVRVHMLIESGDFESIFIGITGKLQTSCLTQGQIIDFCKTYPHRLLGRGVGTFFLFVVRGEYFVADVFKQDSDRLSKEKTSDIRLSVAFYKISTTTLWNPKYRYQFVAPKLSP